MKNLKLTENGKYWMKVAVASAFGNDKMSFDKQVQWTEDNLEQLEALTSEADDRFGFRVAVNELRNGLAGRDVNYVVPMDCSNQALQLYGVLTGNLDTAKLGSLGSGSERVDAYQTLADILNHQLKTEIFTRNVCKKPLMVTLYGSTSAGQKMLDALKMSEEELRTKLHITNPEWTLQAAFEEVMYQIAPYAMTVMAQVQELNNENVGTYRWAMPDGFNVKYDVKSKLNVEISRKSAKGKTFSCHLTSEVYAPSQHNRGMAPNVIHSVDAYLLRELKRKLWDIYMIPIHDSYGVHPNDVDLLRAAYTETLVEMMDKPILSSIMSQIAGHRVEFTKSGTLQEHHIRESVYHLS